MTLGLGGSHSLFGNAHIAREKCDVVLTAGNFPREFGQTPTRCCGDVLRYAHLRRSFRVPHRDER